MGRHSAVDDDNALELPADSAPVPVEETEPQRRGRHARTEDLEHTSPVDIAAVRAAVAQATQDERPTERIALDELRAVAEADASTDRLPSEPAPPAPSPEPATTEAAAPEAPERPGGAGPATKAPSPSPPRGAQPTAADLALLRARPDVRARVIAAVVVPFVLYGAVMLLIGARAAQYLLWMWIPLVSAGVLAGSLLDAAHRRNRDPESPPTH